MEDNKELFEDFEEAQILPLTDEETGEVKKFILRARAVVDGKLYYALIPEDEAENDECGILRVTEDGDDILLETIEDDDEFDKVRDVFDDMFFNEDVDYDE